MSLIGQTLDHYRIVDVLGSGGMGLVYRAEDENLDREVAIKVLPKSSLSNRLARMRFRQEARALSRLNHTHIATVFDFRSQGDIDFLVMELVTGRTLLEVMDEGPLPEAEAIQIGKQVLSALNEAHTAGIVHRDLKPSNILIDTQGQVKVLDFGLAKLLEDREDPAHIQTAEGAVTGTLPYMPPEQIMSEEVSPASDIYALGVLLYEMTSGRRPFLGSNPPELIDAILHQSPEPISKQNPSITRAFEAVTEKALEKDPSARYQSAQEMLQELGVLDADPTIPFSVSTPRRRTRKSPWLILALVTLPLAAILVYLGLGIWSSKSDNAEAVLPEVRGPIVAVLPLVNVSGDPSQDHLGLGIAHSLVNSLSKVRSATMISPADTREFVEERISTREIAEELGANYIIAGTVQEKTNLLYVTLSLIRSDGTVAWADDRQSNSEDIFSLQSHLASDLSDSLRLILTPADREWLNTPPTSSTAAYADYLQAKSFLERPDVEGNLDRARLLFLSAIEKDPGFALAHAGLGEVYWENYLEGRDKEWTHKALEATVDALRLNPEDPSVRYSLAVIYDGTGRSDEAIQELAQALDRQPNNDNAHRLKGEILAKSGDYEAAFNEFRQAIAIRPNYWRNHSTLGLTLYRAGNYLEAAEAFRRVTELQPDLPWGFQMLGFAHHTMGDLDTAAACYETAIELGPSPASYSNLGTIFYRRGEFSRAVEMYKEAIKMRPSSPITHRNLGDAYSQLSRTEDARRSYTAAADAALKILEVNPNDPETTAMLAVYKAKLGEYDDALKLSRRAYDIAPEDSYVLYLNAVVFALSAQEDQAMLTLEKALEAGYNPREAAQDDDFRSLRSIPEFERLLRSYEAEVPE